MLLIEPISLKHLSYHREVSWYYICLDINECNLPNNCHVNSTCANAIGSYICKCVDVYEGNGTLCQGKISNFTVTISKIFSFGQINKMFCNFHFLKIFTDLINKIIILVKIDAIFISIPKPNGKLPH